MVKKIREVDQTKRYESGDKTQGQMETERKLKEKSSYDTWGICSKCKEEKFVRNDEDYNNHGNLIPVCKDCSFDMKL